MNRLEKVTDDILLILYLSVKEEVSWITSNKHSLYYHENSFEYDKGKSHPIEGMELYFKPKRSKEYRHLIIYDDNRRLYFDDDNNCVVDNDIFIRQ